jgi:hypothetical protein
MSIKQHTIESLIRDEANGGHLFVAPDPTPSGAEAVEHPRPGPKYEDQAEILAKLIAGERA